MLVASRSQILAQVRPESTVLDVGGWAKPFARADWVIDLMPYETRGLYGAPDPESERFSADTWLRFDICDRVPWPFADSSVDFAICSHTLEDVRDPIWVCSELERIAAAGYVEVPSRLEEQSLGVHGEWAGWSHHRWLIDQSEAGLRFIHKPHILSTDNRFHFPAWFGRSLNEEERVETLFWQSRLSAREEIFTDSKGFRSELSTYVESNLKGRKVGEAPTAGKLAPRARALLRRRTRRRRLAP